MSDRSIASSQAPVHLVGREGRARSAFTIIEVLISVCILAFCAIPILIMVTSETKKAHLNEFHANAQVQARWAADALQALDYDHLKALAETGSPPSDIPGLDDPALREIPDPLPPVDALLAPYMQMSPQEAPFLKHAVGRSKFFTRHCFFGEIQETPGLGRLVVAITWKLPTDKPGVHHAHIYRRLLARPETSMRTRVPLQKQ